MSTTLLLSGCTSGGSGPRWFESPEPELGSLGAYVGKLALHNDCVVMLIEGGLTTPNVAAADPRERVIPLLSSGFDVVGTDNGFVITGPDGQTFVPGQIVTGEGARYPVKTAKDSRPVAPPPDISKCGTVPFQVKSMLPGSL